MSAATLESPPALRPYIPNRLLDIDDIAELAHIASGTIRHWIREGRFPKPLRMGRVLRWDPRVINEWLSSRGA